MQTWSGAHPVSCSVGAVNMNFIPGLWRTEGDGNYRNVSSADAKCEWRYRSTLHVILWLIRNSFTLGSFALGLILNLKFRDTLYCRL